MEVQKVKLRKFCKVCFLICQGKVRKLILNLVFSFYLNIYTDMVESMPFHWIHFDSIYSMASVFQGSENAST